MRNSKYLVHEKFSHLTDTQIDELLDRYYTNEKIAVLIKEFDIKVSVSRFHTILPFKAQDDCKCKYCDIPMMTACLNRNEPYWGEIIKCHECQHSYHSHLKFHKCECVGCLSEKERELAEINKIKMNFIISERILAKETPVSIQDLSLKDRLYLSALLHTCLSESMESIEPLNTAVHVLAPTKMYCEYILRYLYEKKAIVPCLASKLDAFNIKEDGVEIIDIQSVGWELNIRHNEKFNLVWLINYLKNLEDINDEDVCEIWTEVATYECVEYLAALLEKFRFPQNIGKKTQQIIANTLGNFSTSQVFQFIWISVNKATTFQRLKNVSYTHAVNTIPGNIEIYARRVLANNWLVKGYGRDYDLEQSMISKILYNSLLKIGDEGLKTTPKKQLFCSLHE